MVRAGGKFAREQDERKLVVGNNCCKFSEQFDFVRSFLGDRDSERYQKEWRKSSVQVSLTLLFDTCPFTTNPYRNVVSNWIQSMDSLRRRWWLYTCHMASKGLVPRTVLHRSGRWPIHSCSCKIRWRQFGRRKGRIKRFLSESGGQKLSQLAYVSLFQRETQERWSLRRALRQRSQSQTSQYDQILRDLSNLSFKGKNLSRQN